MWSVCATELRASSVHAYLLTNVASLPVFVPDEHAWQPAHVVQVSFFCFFQPGSALLLLSEVLLSLHHSCLCVTFISTSSQCLDFHHLSASPWWQMLFTHFRSCCIPTGICSVFDKKHDTSCTCACVLPTLATVHCFNCSVRFVFAKCSQLLT